MTMLHSRPVNAIAAILALAGPPAVAWAHHSFASEFDAAKTVTVEGVITRAQIVNPHSWLYLDVKNKDGSVTNWGFEFGTPATLHVKGLTKADLQPGMTVRIEGYRSRNGGAFGYTHVATVHGKTVQMGNSYAPVKLAEAH